MAVETIKKLAASYFEAYRSIRRHLHAHPELSFKEYETAAYVREHLSALGIEHSTIGETGVVAMLQGKPSSRVVALRADMDALPIQEENKVEYASLHPGVMHACGHDVHTSCLLGAARILNELRHEWEGTLKLIFQPGEEKNPGGASILMREGVLENPKPERIYALHVHPQLEVGKLGFVAGKVMASADELYITVKGKGGHAAKPNLTADTILTASQMVVALQQVVSRNNNPFSPSVLSICAVNGGFTTNVIPSEVKLMGTFRAMDEKWRFEAHDRIKKIVQDVASAHGAEATLEISVGYPAVINDQQLVDGARILACELIGSEKTVEAELSMGAEDFGYYTQAIPGCFFRLGTGNVSRGITSGVHTPTFDVDEEAMKTGIAMMAYLGMKG
ncbi:MAG: M20 family metallopeptidase [Chitinophagaceae bacterium]|jgi:amidohydrolase